MVKIQTEMFHANGIPFGGIGTGTIELWPDGHFYNWEIYNLGPWASRTPRNWNKMQPKMGPEAFTFYIRTKENNKAPITRRLGLRTDQHNLYSLSWLKSIQKIEYDGKFPMATLKYQDTDLPIELSMKTMAPFIPHDAKTSGTPGFYITFSMKNKTNSPVEVSLLSLIKNPLAWGATDRRLTNIVSQTDKTTFLTMRTSAKKVCPATLGNMTLSMTGGEISYIGADYTDYFLGYNSHGPDLNSFQSIFYDFRRTGKLPNLGNQVPNPSKLFRMIPGDKAKKQELITQLKQYAFAMDVLNRFQEVDPKVLESETGINAYLDAVNYQLNKLASYLRNRQTWGDGALCSTITLNPGEEKNIELVLSWFFPNHKTADRTKFLTYDVGHMYANWFKDALEVNEFLVKNSVKICNTVEQFASSLFDTTLDPILAESWTDQLTTITKCSWWTKAGDFAIWEGWGCCGFHTMDITYQGSFNLLALFPELQKAQMELGAKYQRDDGRVHHFFIPDLTHVDHGFDRVDMNPQFVMLVCRDYLWTGDKDYLKRLWPHIIKAMDNSALLDTDGDGLPDHDTRRNTYDNWNFFGTPSYIASLWLGALRAGIRLAEDLGEKTQKDKWQSILDKAIPNFDKKLWNGEYYSLWVDKNRRDDCCMTDQMSGEWFTKLMGLEPCLPVERIQAAMKTIAKFNYSPEDGLLNASYPAGKPKLFPAYMNLQQTAPWTGIEYAIGSMMLDFGLVDEGTAVIKTVHERHARAGRVWNHVECGDHYYRAMSSWAILTAATGFKLDIPKQRYSILPMKTVKNCTAPWFSPTGWGVFKLTEDQFELSCLEGNITFKELKIKSKTPKQSVKLSNQSINGKFETKDGSTFIQFEKPVSISAGQQITIN